MDGKTQQRRANGSSTGRIKPWPRTLSSVIGALSGYAVWRVYYQTQLPLPYQAELTLLLEGLWGLLVGLGGFVGIAVLQTLHALRGRAHDPQEADGAVRHSLRPEIRIQWTYVALAGLGGLLGGLIWWLVARWAPLRSTSLAMTVLWGIVYTGAILLPPLLMRRPRLPHRDLLILLLLPALPPIALLLARLHIDPDQADVDMLAGLAIRAAVVTGAVLIVPPLGRREPSYPALATHVNALVDAIARRERRLTRAGVQLHLGELVSYSSASIRKFCSGERKPSKEATLQLLRIGAEYGLGHPWGEGLLHAAGHLAQEQIIDQLHQVYGEPGQTQERSP